MAFTFRPAVREQIRLLIALVSPTGGGKTFSAMKLATGMSNGQRFAVIDTENGRASMYADYFKFDVLDLTAPFTSERYQEAILAADAAKYPVIVVDSFSHEYEGDGGILDRQETELARMVAQSKQRGDKREEWKLEEAHNMRAWNEAKAPHKKLKTKLLQLKAHVIFGLRADDKIEITKDGNGKTVIQPKKSLVGLDGWIPICEKRFPYELTMSLLFTADRPGIPKPIKLQEQHKQFFPLDKPISEESGRLIGEWAKGSVSGPAKQAAAESTATNIKGTDDPQKAAEPVPEATKQAMQDWTPMRTADLLRDMEKASDMATLKDCGAKAKFAPAEDQELLRQIYTARQKQLKAAKSEPVTEATA